MEEVIIQIPDCEGFTKDQLASLVTKHTELTHICINTDILYRNFEELNKIVLESIQTKDPLVLVANMKKVLEICYNLECASKCVGDMLSERNISRIKTEMENLVKDVVINE